jgi:Pvc16 N-terminal domain
VSNYKAVATVTAILQRVLQSAVQADVDGVRVTTIQPRNIGNGTPETGINLFLYHVTRNTAYNNADVTPLRVKGTPVKRQAALDLHYMISFYGNDTELEPQRLLGSVVRTLKDRPTISSELIEQAIRDPTYRFLEGSNLADQLQQLTIVPMDMNLDDLSKVWSTFFQAPYLLSMAYKVTVVMLEGEDSLKRALPVGERYLGGISPFPNRPVIEEVVSITGKLDPILADSVLYIRGKQLASELTKVRIGGFELSPSQISDRQITIALSGLSVNYLRAGVQGLQVIHCIQDVHATLTNRTVESNIAPFVLRPSIKSVSTSDPNERRKDLQSAILTLQVDVVVGIKQRVILAMNEWSIDNPVGYQLEAIPRKTDTDTVTFTLEAIKPGEYLLRLIIDGAESLLSIDTDETSPTFNWYNAPKVRIE